jgi:deaminated glutathione amidase
VSLRVSKGVMTTIRTKSSFRVALVQLDVGAERADNLARAQKLIARAARRGARVVCLPELFSYMGSFRRPNEVAETLRGPSLSMLRELAERHQIFIVGGSILMRARRGLPLNTCFFIGPDSRIVARYSKMHLFDIEVPGKISFHESHVMQPGRSATIARTLMGTFGFAICNDLRYPELFRRMACAGAEVIFVPSAFTKFTGRDHWLALARVRAIENQCFVVAVNQSGRNADGVRFFGGSIVCDPWGKVLVEGPAKGDALLIADIDLERLKRLRKQLPALQKIRRTYPLRCSGV